MKPWVGETKSCALGLIQSTPRGTVGLKGDLRYYMKEGCDYHGEDLKLFPRDEGLGLIVRDGSRCNIIMNLFSSLVEEEVALTFKLLNKRLILMKLLLIMMFQTIFVYMLMQVEFGDILIVV